MNKKMLISAAAATAMLLGVSACGESADNGSDGSSASEKSDQKKGDKKDEQKKGQQSAPKPDLKGIPAVVATVNGTKIGKKEFISIYEGQFQQQAMSGGNVDQDKLKKQTANTMVETELLVQEASSNGFEATDKDVDKELKSLSKQNGMKPKQFLDAMSKQGMEEKQVRAQLQDQLQVTDYIEDEAGDIKPSEKELRDYYDKLAKQQKQQSKGQQGKGQQSGELPPFKDVKKQLEEQMVGQKQGEVAQGLVKDLKKDADIDVKI